MDSTKIYFKTSGHNDFIENTILIECIKYTDNYFKRVVHLPVE